MWQIRELTSDDVPRVGAVLGLARLGQGDGFYLVAWEDDEPLGHAHLALTDPPELQDVSVRPEHRRRGVATALAGAAERAVVARGFDRLRLSVSVDNDAAHALYRQLGYGDAGQIRGIQASPSVLRIRRDLQGISAGVGFVHGGGDPVEEGLIEDEPVAPLLLPP